MRVPVVQAFGARGQRSLPMKSLEFEKVSIASARQELDGQVKRVDTPERSRQRAPQHAAVLLDATRLWMDGLPAAVRPAVLARRFPRIANSIAELWRRVARCEEYLGTLVVDSRGDRTGFPLEVAQELAALRGYYAELHPQNRSAWDLELRGD
jgi:hypothetical protein